MVLLVCQLHRSAVYIALRDWVLDEFLVLRIVVLVLGGCVGCSARDGSGGSGVGSGLLICQELILCFLNSNPFRVHVDFVDDGQDWVLGVLCSVWRIVVVDVRILRPYKRRYAFQC